MPYLVRENLFIGNIGDAAEVLQNGSDDITHILSVLSSASISFFSEWRSETYNRGEKIDSSKFGPDPSFPAEKLSSNSKILTNKEARPNTPAYRCKKCRRLVALKENVVDHVPGEGETCFNWRKRSGTFSRSEDDECSSIFIEPLCWMKSVEEGGLEGKLSCINCEARLGYFNWSGIQCSCGSWITPAFQLHKSRVDISTI
ncbi:Probable inactive dual specificity protein phosphatase-like [Striga hermonthica]|uniref:protein-tyrosine-phosphatase n=1 Tax=Striga hermonthica TaxID=68872 RepID=A0A9N7MS31_STRHE|nr:Probable inactive dual specificity protein phosphatase-like [Striga hermonthica]